MGIDAAGSKSGFSIVQDGVPQRIGVWKPKRKDDPQPGRLIEWGDAVRSLLVFEAPDVVVVEECAPHRNPMTFRSLVRFENVASYETTRYGAVLVLHRVSEARKIVLGAGNVKKEDAFKIMKQRFPDLGWVRQTSGGDDQSDALVMALAAPRLMERR